MRSKIRTIEELAAFRYALRRFLRFSEDAARDAGVTPQQHQLMLGTLGFTGRGNATISELAEFLQEKNNSVVGLVERAVDSGLVRREAGLVDRRQVVVSLTPRGEEILLRLSLLHQGEVKRIRKGFLLKDASRAKEDPGGKKDHHARLPRAANQSGKGKNKA